MKITQKGEFVRVSAVPEPGEMFPVITITKLITVQPTEIVCEFDTRPSATSPGGLGLRDTFVHGKRLYRNGRQQWGDRAWEYHDGRAPQELWEIIRAMHRDRYAKYIPEDEAVKYKAQLDEALGVRA